MDRPSRFDRKYFFPLPTLQLREEYLALWNGGAAADLQLSPSGIAAIAGQTSDFSFAYLKELWLSSIMAWMRDPKPMDEVMASQVGTLREQMSAVEEHTPVPAAHSPFDFDDE